MITLMAKSVGASCNECGKSSFVTVGVKRYCANCGTRYGGVTAQVATKTSGRALSDVKPTGAKPTVAGVRRAPKPATALHGHQVGGVVDLRQAKVDPIATKKTAPAKAASAARVAPKVTPMASTKQGTVTIPALKKAAPKPIQKFAPRKQTAAVVSKPKEDKPTAPVLPNHIANQIDQLAQKAIEADKAQRQSNRRTRSSILSNAIIAAKEPQKLNPATLASALVVFTLMIGFVWMQNAPKWSFQSAAQQAGIQASLPTYLPSSYAQIGKPTIKPGEVTLNYNGPSATRPLVITQKRTDMDAGSLRDSHVSQKSDNYQAIPGQGLTVYLYEAGNVATWVNHGVWYTVTGAATLGRDQILKIAYGL